jgi:DNA-dependent RNA polymerase auxiliary subunit epsilon
MKYIIFLLIITNQLYALVSIKPVDIGENTGVTGGVELGLDTKRGNIHKDTYKASARIMYDNNISYVVWTQVSGEYAKANKVEDTNKKYLHIRYIHKLSDELLRYELFLQAQEDKFKAIKQRRVAGLGLRIKMFSTAISGQGYFGLGTLYENIRYIEPTIDPYENNIRVNSYLAYSIKFMSNSSLAYTIYYQPLVEEFSDYVMTNDLELKLQVFKKLYLRFSLSYDKDSQPSKAIAEKYDISQSTTFLYEF